MFRTWHIILEPRKYQLISNTSKTSPKNKINLAPSRPFLFASQQLAFLKDQKLELFKTVAMCIVKLTLLHQSNNFPNSCLRVICISYTKLCTIESMLEALPNKFTYLPFSRNFTTLESFLQKVFKWGNTFQERSFLIFHSRVSITNARIFHSIVFILLSSPQFLPRN